MTIEHEMILTVVLKNKTQLECERIEKLFSQRVDWCEIAGQVINHRLGGYFYYGLKDKQRNQLPGEFKKGLELLIYAQEEQFKNRAIELNNIVKVFEQYYVEYACLKGAVFCAELYEAGERRSNDIDIMVEEKNLRKLDLAMRSCGYIQSFLKNGKFEEASKREKLIQRMNYHDLVPYVKRIPDGIIEVDINFLFDSKENIVDSKVFKYGLNEYSNNFYKVKGLPFETHLLFLCIHFYREATNTIWTKGKRDIVLYKVVDIINLIRIHNNELNVSNICGLAKELKIDKKCYFTFKTISKIYPNEKILKELYEGMEREKLNEMELVYVEGENRYIKRNKSFEDEIFNWKGLGEEDIVN